MVMLRRRVRMMEVMLVRMFYLPLDLMHQVDKNAIGKVIFMRNEFHDRTKRVKELVMMDVKIFLVY